MLNSVLFIALILISAMGQAKAAPPVLGPDCGVGATIAGSKNAGKVNLGDPSPDSEIVSCTLIFSWPKAPACVAQLEAMTAYMSRGQGPLGAETTATTLTIRPSNGALPFIMQNDVISYLCVGQ